MEMLVVRLMIFCIVSNVQTAVLVGFDCSKPHPALQMKKSSDVLDVIKDDAVNRVRYGTVQYKYSTSTVLVPK